MGDRPVGSRHGSPIIIRARRRTGVSGQQLQVTPARCRQKLWRRSPLERGTALGARASGWSPPSAIKLRWRPAAEYHTAWRWRLPVLDAQSTSACLQVSVRSEPALQLDAPRPQMSLSHNDCRPLGAGPEAGKSERNSEPHHRRPTAPWVAWQRALLLFLAACFGACLSGAGLKSWGAYMGFKPSSGRTPVFEFPSGCIALREASRRGEVCLLEVPGAARHHPPALSGLSLRCWLCSCC